MRSFFSAVTAPPTSVPTQLITNQPVNSPFAPFTPTPTSPTRVPGTTTLSPTAAPIGVPSSPSTTLPLVCVDSTVLQSASGSFGDGTAPSYLPNQRCTWTVNAGAAATIQFQSFNLEQGYDFLRVCAARIRLGGIEAMAWHASLMGDCGAWGSCCRCTRAPRLWEHRSRP